MKHLKIFMLASVLIFTACQKEKSVSYRNSLEFNATIEQNSSFSTKASGTSWDAGDAVGIYMKEASGELSASCDNAVNVKYITTAGDGSFSAAIAEEEIAFPSDGTNVDFIAYYPYQATLADGAYLIDVSDQSSIPTIDLLYSNNVTNVSSSAEVVNLNFKHHLSQLILQITAETAVGSIADLEISIDGLHTKGLCNLANGAIVTQEQVTTVYPYVSSASADYVVVNALLIPGDKLSSAEITFSLNGTCIDSWTPNEQPLESGKKYTYDLKLKANGEVEEVAPNGSISDWEEGTEFIDERDGQSYKLVTIGEQTWMAENLAYLPEGKIISAETEGAEDEGQAFKAHYYVRGFEGGDMAALGSDTEGKSNYDTYGVIYNWYAATATPETVTDQASFDSYLTTKTSQGICPVGWHLPTEEEYQKLLAAVGKANDNAGEVLKSINLWEIGGKDTYGFGLLPGGRRADNGSIESLTYGYLWTSNIVGYTDNIYGHQVRATCRYVSNSTAFKVTTYRGSMGASVRCVKD
ncbi:MAG: fimbrillin family protein [Bacteroidales bacterium]